MPGGGELGGGTAAAQGLGLGGRRSCRVGEKSNFSLTCSLLSQYIKENGGLGELGFGIMASPSAPGGKGSKPEPPRTMNLFPGVEAPKEEEEEEEEEKPLAQLGATKAVVPSSAGSLSGPPQMTIFYGGKVLVFDNFPADKARELMGMATRGKSTPLPAAAPHDRDELKTAQLPNASDLPIARRISLNRFLEKRKDRIISKAPYRVDGSPPGFDPPSPAPAAYQAKLVGMVSQTWLGLATSSLAGSNS